MDQLRQYKIEVVWPAEDVLPVGAGAFGKVYGISYNGAPCVGKSLHNILLGRGKYEAVPRDQSTPLIAKFVKECVLHSRLRHPNIVQFIGVEYGVNIAVKDQIDLVLIMERMDKNLDSCLEAHPHIPLPIKLSVLRDVSAGLMYLHSFAPPIIHGDLTTTNILLTQDWRAKIADFGNSVDQSILSTAPGALAYMPPEALVKPLKYDSKLDIFSFGIVSLCLGNQVKVYKSEKQDEHIQVLGAAPELKPLHHIVTWCCEPDPRKIPTSVDLNTHLQKLCPHNSDMKMLMDGEINRLSNVVETLRKEKALSDQRLAEAQVELEEMKRGRKEEFDKHREEIDLLKTEVTMQRAQTQMYVEDFRQERNDRVRAVEAKERVEEEMKCHKIECEKNNVRMQLDIDRLSKELQAKEEQSKVDRMKLEKLQTSEEMIRQLKAKLEEISAADATKVKKSEKQKAIKDKIEQLQNENESLQKEVKRLKKQLQSVQGNLSDTESIMQQQMKGLKDELNAANEEIAVKVAQVKQYQKQVEAYKQQGQTVAGESSTDSVRMLSTPAPIHQNSLPQLPSVLDSYSDSGIIEPVHLLSGNSSGNGSSLKLTHPAVLPTTAEPLRSDSRGTAIEDDDDDLPPPISFNPHIGQMQHPAADSSGGHIEVPHRPLPPHQALYQAPPNDPNDCMHGVPRSALSDDRHHTCSLGMRQVEKDDRYRMQQHASGTHQAETVPLPPNQHLSYEYVVSHSNRPWSLPLSMPHQAQSISTAGWIDGDRSHAFLQDGAGVDGYAPLDPNLRCQVCDVVFRKGEIQKYKRHVETCTH